MRVPHVTWLPSGVDVPMLTYWSQWRMLIVYGWIWLTVCANPPQFWEHAHNDLVQFPIELGLPGMLLIAAGGVFLAVGLVRNYFWENPISLANVFGCALVVVYAWWDSPFQKPRDRRRSGKG